jgi:hypothetical protein
MELMYLSRLEMLKTEAAMRSSRVEGANEEDQ